MDSPRIGGRGRNSGQGTPRMSTPAGERLGSFVAPAAKGTVTLGKGKGRLRAGMETSISGLHATSSMLLNQEDSYEILDPAAGYGAGAGFTGERERIAASRNVYTPDSRTEGEKGKVFAKSDEIAVRLHENLPIDVQRAMGVDSQFFSHQFYE